MNAVDRVLGDRGTAGNERAISSEANFTGVRFQPTDTSRYLIYQKARRNADWNPAANINFGKASLLPADRQEMAVKLASSSTFTEEIGLLTASKLLRMTRDYSTRLCLASQVSDEARHAEAFALYAKSRGTIPTSPGPTPVKMLNEIERLSNFTKLLLVHTFMEGFALDQFRIMARVFSGDALGDIYGLVMKDEARHVLIGLESIKSHRAECDPPEFDEALDWAVETSGAFGQLTDEFYEWFAGIAEISAPALRDMFARGLDHRLKFIGVSV